MDGQPATEVLEELYESLSPAEQDRVRTSLFLGLVQVEGQEHYVQGDFLIRNLIGMDPDEGVLAVGARLTPHQVVQFHLRDAETSRQDLQALLERQARQGEDKAASGALLFSCLGRGQHLYGVANHDSTLFLEQLGEVPLAGFFCNGEIGPVGGRTFLHGFTSSFGLFRPRSP